MGIGFYGFKKIVWEKMAKIKILLVEDETIAAMDIQARLEALGYEVPYVASRGEEAIEKALEIEPDLILMDIVLKGDMDGIEAAIKIHENQDTPLIYLTAYSDEQTLERAKISEPFGYVLKPFEDREIQISIEMALYKHDVDQKLKKSEEKYRKIVEKFIKVSNEILQEISKP